MLSNWINGTVKTNIDKFISKYNTLDINTCTTCLGTLDGYYNLFEYLEDGKAYLTGSNDQILVTGKRKYIFVLDPCNDRDIKLLNNLQRSASIFSVERLPLSKESEQLEIIYNIPHIFDPANYKNSRQRNRRIKRPFKWFDNNGIEILDKPKSIKDVEDLHAEWVRRRIENPKIFTKFFPKKKYFHIFERFLDNPDNIDYKGVFFYGNLNGEEELLSFRIISQVDNRGYDLANIARYWCDPNVSNYCYIIGLKYFYDNFGIEDFNCGYYYNKSLGEFKMKYPHTTEAIYMYPRNKKMIATEKLSDYL